jgi:hypothetical protein
MTIKTQGGKVITKDGKVSCECCEEPECCMYPAEPFVNGLYTYEDLPDTVIWYDTGQIFNRLNPPIIEPGIIITHASPENPGEDYIYTGSEVVDNWVRVTGGSSIGGFGLCLINSLDGVPDTGSDRSVDDFADTYTVSYGGIQFVGPATRQSLCFWQSNECQSPNRWSWAIQYGTLEDPYKWAVFLEEPGSGECIPAGVFIKNDPQNSPAGTYSDGTQTLTVS